MTALPTKEVQQPQNLQKKPLHANTQATSREPGEGHAFQGQGGVFWGQNRRRGEQGQPLGHTCRHGVGGGALLRGSFHPCLQFLPVTPQYRLYNGFLSEYKEKRGEEEGAEEETNKGGKRMTSGGGGDSGEMGEGEPNSTQQEKGCLDFMTHVYRNLTIYLLTCNYLLFPSQAVESPVNFQFGTQQEQARCPGGPAGDCKK